MVRKTAAENAGRWLDKESAVMLYEGLNMTQLALLFEMNDKDLKMKMTRGGVESCGTRNGYPIYRVKEVMPFVVKPGYDVEEYIKKMHHNELPKMLTKEYWAGQRSKQEFLERAGDLWPTDKVVEKVGEFFKLVKMNVTLTTDAVERQVELSERQRTIIKNQMDGLLNDLHRAIQETFKGNDDDGELQQTEDDETL
jgi:hypothetical protein